MQSKLLLLFCILTMSSYSFLCCKAKRTLSSSQDQRLEPPDLTSETSNQGNEQSAVSIDIDFGGADYIEIENCTSMGCQNKRVDSGNLESLAFGNLRKSYFRACVNHETNEAACTEWQDAEFNEISEEPDDQQNKQDADKQSLNPGETAAIVFGSLTAAPVIITFAYYTRNYLDIEKLSGHASQFDNDARPTPIPTGEQGKILFAFDLDETLTNVAYKEKYLRNSRERGTNSGKPKSQQFPELKPGMADMLLSIARKGHPIVIVTANIRPSVETFLMQQLGFDSTKADDITRFRQLIQIKQPNVTIKDPLLGFFLKPSKGRMLQEAVSGIDPKTKLAGIVFSDDKPRFHRSVLSRTYTQPLDGSSAKVPVVGFRVGEGEVFKSEPFGFLQRRLDKSAQTAAGDPPGKSTQFAMTIKHLVDDETARGKLLSVMGREDYKASLIGSSELIDKVGSSPKGLDIEISFKVKTTASLNSYKHTLEKTPKKPGFFDARPVNGDPAKIPTFQGQGTQQNKTWWQWLLGTAARRGK